MLKTAQFLLQIVKLVLKISKRFKNYRTVIVLLNLKQKENHLLILEGLALLTHRQISDYNKKMLSTRKKV